MAYQPSANVKVNKNTNQIQKRINELEIELGIKNRNDIFTKLEKMTGKTAFNTGKKLAQFYLSLVNKYDIKYVAAIHESTIDNTYTGKYSHEIYKSVESNIKERNDFENNTMKAEKIIGEEIILEQEYNKLLKKIN